MDGWPHVHGPRLPVACVRVGPHMHPFGVAMSRWSLSTLNHRACNRACFLSTPATAVPVRACMTARMCVQRVEYSCTS